MKSKLAKFALTASFMLAMAFTFSCSSDDGDDNPLPPTTRVISSSGGGSSSSSAGYQTLDGCPDASTEPINAEGIGSVTCGGHEYKTVKIGTQHTYQIWMAENLNYNASGSKCYGNLDSNCAKYGHLYDWSTAMGISSSYNSSSYNPSSGTKYRGICPSGWHIPNNAEWDTLMTAVGGSSIAGTKLMSDNYGFAALLGGYGGSDHFYFIGSYGNWWSSSEYDAYYAGSQNMIYGYERVGYYNYNKSYLQSVRCLQD